MREEMKEIRSCIKFSFLCLTLFSAAALSFPSPGDPACSLDFTTFPYKPIGGCTDIHEKLDDWNVVEQCSLFGSSSFENACGICTLAISNEVEKLLDDVKGKGSGVEEATCRVAVVVAVFAGMMNRTVGIESDDDFDRCLPAMSGSVLCSATSSTGRPTIDLVFNEMELAWINTQIETRARKNRSLPSSSPLSKSLEISYV